MVVEHPHGEANKQSDVGVWNLGKKPRLEADTWGLSAYREYLKRWHWTICKLSFNYREVCAKSEIWMCRLKGKRGLVEGRETQRDPQGEPVVQPLMSKFFLFGRIAWLVGC